MPPAEGFVAEDLDRLPLPPRTELMDGCLVFRAPRPMFHSRLKSFLEWELNDQSPDALEVCRGMTVTPAEADVVSPSASNPVTLTRNEFAEEYECVTAEGWPLKF